MLPPATEADLTQKLQALQRDTRRQLVVATIPDLGGETIEDYGIALGRSWGVGLRDVNNGIILFIAPNEPAGHRGPRIEVGIGLEPIVTDIFAGRIIREQMMPKLVAGDVPGAMTVGTNALIAQLRASPEEAQARLDAATAAFDREHRAPAGGSGGGNGGGLPLGLIVLLVILAFVILPALGGRRGRRYRGGGGDSAWPIVLWSIGNEIARSGGGSSWSGGSSSGGGWGGSSGVGTSWGGGGFSGGGGGSFGGGGASGSW